VIRLLQGTQRCELQILSIGSSTFTQTSGTT
jgi:hypothetical protein